MQTSTETVSSDPFATGDNKSATAVELLGWYDANARRLPWRAPPGTPAPDPYRVWLSEVMLQQTTVAAVGPYFANFTTRWPTVTALAAAEEGEVMAAWAGLGYYARARNLIACAREVAKAGGFPATEAGLRELPGLGAYTAAAIAAIAFGEAAVVVDANVERVVARLAAIDEPLPGARRAIRAATAAITPPVRAGDFAQAMMDLGAMICTVKAPRCMLCPLRARCRAAAEGRAETLPVKPAKAARPVRRGRAFWIEHDGAVLLVRRKPSGMLGGMRALPDDGWAARRDGDGVAPIAADWKSGGVVRHGFTHFEIELQLMLCASPEMVNPALAARTGGEFWPIADLAAAGLPTVFARAAQLASAETTGPGKDASDE